MEQGSDRVLDNTEIYAHRPRRLLMVNLPYQGHMNPTLATVRTLMGKGYRVDYIADPRWRDAVEATGARFISYDSYSEHPGRFESSVKSIAQAARTVLRVGREGKYSALLYEGFFVYGKTLADRLGLPSIRLNSIFAYTPKVLETITATGGWHVSLMLKGGLALKLLSRLMHRRGLIESDDLVREMVANLPTMTYVYTAESFQMDHESLPADRFHFIGPSLDGRPRTDETVDRLAGEAGDRPIIYASLGTLFNDFTKFYLDCIRAFGDQPVEVVMAVGSRFDRSKLGRIPGNFHIYDSVNQLAVLDHTSLFITHGGMNSVNEALYSQVPMVLVPMADDQPAVAGRVQELELGRVIRRQDLSSKTLAHTAREVMNSQRIRESLAAMATEMKSSGGNTRLASELDDLLCEDSLQG